MTSIADKARELARSLAPNPDTARGGKYARDARVASMVAPGSVSFGNVRSMEIDGVSRRGFAVRDFATVNYAGWANQFNNVPGSRATICVRPADGTEMAKQMDHASARAGVSLVNGGSASKMVQSQLNRDNADATLKMMFDQKATFLTTTFTYQLEGATADEVGAEYRRIHDAARPAGFTVDPCARAQERVLRSCDPMNTKDDAYLAPRFEINMPSSTLGASHPFACGGIIDSGGTVLGTDVDGAMVRVDMTRTGPNKPNRNQLATGGTGSGKSYLCKKNILSSYAAGTRFIIIDPDSEYKPMCRSLHGQYVNLGGSSHAAICPLQPKVTNHDFDGDDEDGEFSAADVLRSTMSFVREFYSIAFHIRTEELGYLDRALVKAYGRYGLTYDTPFAKVDFDNYPTMDELADILREMAAAAKRPRAKEVYEELAVHTATGGSGGVFGNLWGNKTNVTLKSDFVVLDFNALMAGSVSSAARQAQLYLALSFVWDSVCRTRLGGDRPLQIMVDEASLLLGTDADAAVDANPRPYAAAMLATISRRARKYSAGITICTQSLQDLLTPAVKAHGEVIIENANYVFVFKTKVIDPLVEVLHIPVSKAKMAPSFNRGECIFRAGNAMCVLHVEANPAEERYFGTAGGR